MRERERRRLAPPLLNSGTMEHHKTFKSPTIRCTVHVYWMHYVLLPISHFTLLHVLSLFYVCLFILSFLKKLKHQLPPLVLVWFSDTNCMWCVLNWLTFTCGKEREECVMNEEREERGMEKNWYFSLSIFFNLVLVKGLQWNCTCMKKWNE